MHNKETITLSGSSYDEIMDAKYPYEKERILRNVLKENNIKCDFLWKYNVVVGSLNVDVEYIVYEDYQETFDKLIKGQKLVNTSWLNQSSETNYVGGFGMHFENDYSIYTHGGCSSGSDYNCSWITDENLIVIAKKEIYE